MHTASRWGEGTFCLDREFSKSAPYKQKIIFHVASCDKMSQFFLFCLDGGSVVRHKDRESRALPEYLDKVSGNEKMLVDERLSYDQEFHLKFFVWDCPHASEFIISVFVNSVACISKFIWKMSIYGM